MSEFKMKAAYSSHLKANKKDREIRSRVEPEIIVVSC